MMRKSRFYQWARAFLLLSGMAWTNGLLAAPATDAVADPIAAAVQPAIDGGALAGAVVAVANSNQVLTLRAFGYADLQSKRQMETNDVFWIASQTKPMTATALMMLVEEQKLAVSDPVEKFLPEFKGLMVTAEKDSDHVLLRKADHPITIREILSHTSGLAFSSPLEQPTLDLLPLRDSVRSYAMMPLLFQPGTKYQYSNAGINTAARVMEVVSGTPYEQFLQKRLLQPLGMTETGFRPSGPQLQRLALSYKKADSGALIATKIGQLRYPLDDPTRNPMPAGGLFSTAADITRFCQMILNGGTYGGKRYLSESSILQMTTKQTGEAVSNEYGFGWATGKGWCGHDGAYNTSMKIDREHGLIMVWLVQDASYGSEAVKTARKAFEAAAVDAFSRTSGGDHSR